MAQDRSGLVCQGGAVEWVSTVSRVPISRVRVSLVLLTGFRDVPGVRLVALWTMGGSFASFIVLYSVKAFQNPDFCRSETHLHRMKKLELEYMGSESEMLPGEIVEEQTAIEAPPHPPQIGGDMNAEVGSR